MSDPFTMVSSSEKSLRLARRYALESNYDVAVAFYTGIDKDLTNCLQCGSNTNSNSNSSSGSSHNKEDSTNVALLREKVAEECILVRAIQAELKALVNPSSAAQLDRPSHDNISDTTVPSRAATTRPARRTSTTINNTTVSNRNTVAMTRPAVMSVPPPDSTAARNEILYGDRDRFGPVRHKTPQRNASPLVRRRVKAGLQPLATRTAGRTPATTSSSGAVGSNVNNNNNSTTSNTTNRPRRQGARAAVPRFAARAGEEELVSLIEADMHVGPLSLSWDDVAGLTAAKGLLEEAVVYPVLMPDYYTGIRRPWKGVLLYGPPGTGKTMLAKAVASECNTTFFNISPATLTSKWRGDSEKLIRVLFEMARHYAPSTIFIDEIDSLCGQRGDSGEHEASRRAKGTLLAQMDGVGVDPGKIVMVLGATNHPWSIDEAMRRRLEKRIYIPLPDFNDRLELFRINTKSLKLSPDVDFTKLSKILEGRYYSCADITNLVRDAAMMTMRRFMEETDKTELKKRAAEIGKLVAEQPTTMKDFLDAVKNVPSSINVDQITRFEKWKKEFETNL
ncbi:Vps4 oligomerization [Trypanosoma melophagium]|uniref:Vps4 oligomerization n=1 Tax=Trypanosoma melophagium TaxID=715481 RepID=UPI00351A0073|nr:Vps4 oligomerization [Trypanosoma melophagium]